MSSHFVAFFGNLKPVVTRVQSAACEQLLSRPGQETASYPLAAEPTSPVEQGAKPTPKALQAAPCLVNPLGHPHKASHLCELRRIQAAHGTETVQAQEVDACQRLGRCKITRIGTAESSTQPSRLDGFMLVLWLMCLQTLQRVFRPAWRSSRDVLPLKEPGRQLLRWEVRACERWYAKRYVLLPDSYGKKIKLRRCCEGQMPFFYMVQHHSVAA